MRFGSPFHKVLKPGTVSAGSDARLMALIAILLATCCAGGCVGQPGSSRPMGADMEVFAQASAELHAVDSLCLFPCNSAPETAAAAPALTSVFHSRLVQRRPFRDVKLASGAAKSDEEALWFARKAGCALAMRQQLVYMLDGTGAMPTELVVRTRILDAKSGGVLWDVKQHGWSTPGCDIDLTWMTFVGEPARRCRVLADDLAEKFAAYLTQPAVDRKQMQH